MGINCPVDTGMHWKGNNMWSVSYYVEPERYWQFAGEFAKLDDALDRARYLRQSSNVKTRVRRVN
jgi:hypothetical protein